MRTRVSVIIPSYNRADYLVEAIESVTRQTYPAYEILVVDDGSEEDLASVCARYETVTYVRRPHAGVSAARNAGLHAATGELVVFLDNDDRLVPEALEIGVAQLARRPGHAFVCGDCRTIDASGAPESAMRARARQRPVCYAVLLAGQHLVPPGGRILRRQAVLAVGGFDEDLAHGEDTDLWLRIAQRFPVASHDRVVMEYRWHEGNVSKNVLPMFLGLMHVLERQRAFVQRSGRFDYEDAYRFGERFWLRLYGPVLPWAIAHALRRGRARTALRALGVALGHAPRALVEEAAERLLCASIPVEMLIEPEATAPERPPVEASAERARAATTVRV